MTIENFFETVYKPLKLRGKSPETARLYRLSIRSFSRTLGRPAELSDFTDESVSRHLQRLADDLRAAATINKDRSQLLAIWRFAAQRKLVEVWPNVPEEIEPQRTPMAWLPEEIDKLMASAARQKGFVGNVPAADYWSALLSVILDTGERIGAVISTEWARLSGEWLVIPAEVRKGKRRDRAYKLSQESIELLSKIRKYRTKYIFEWPKNKCYIWTVLGKILDQAGLPSDRRSKFHRLRRTVASACAAAGMDPQRAMDHRDWRTTELYLDSRIIGTPQSFEAVRSYMQEAKRIRHG